MKKLFGLILAVLLLAGAAFAISDLNEAPYLQSRYAKTNCDAQFSMADAMDLLAVDENASGINELIIEINSNLSALEGYADSGDKANYNSQAVATNASIGSLNAQIRNAIRTDMKGMANREKRVQLQQQHQANRTEFVECRKNSNLSFVLARVNSYGNIISAWENKIQKYGDRNMDVAGMNQVIADAQTQVIAPLQSAYDSGDYNAAKDAVKTHCLYDGCDSGNFHFSARIEIAKMNAFMYAVQTAAGDFNMSAEWQQGIDSINAASEALNGINGAKYTEETRASVWDSIKACGETLRTMVQNMKGKGSDSE